MPELPEVETIKKEIEPNLIGRHIKEIELLWEGIVKYPDAAEFKTRLTGRKIRDLNRRGKYLLIGIDHADTLIMHLKMSGSLLLTKDPAAAPPQFTRAIFKLDDGQTIFFRDPRKFACLWLIDDTEKVIGKLGPEALGKDLTLKRFSEIINKHHTPIKALLCDQTVIAGIGNMYADEALFLSRIHPLRLSDSLDDRELRQLYNAVREILLMGIENKGASIVNYYRPDGTKGSAHTLFRVSHHKGEPCRACGTPIERIKVRGRGSYFCPNCQPNEPIKTDQTSPVSKTGL